MATQHVVAETPYESALMLWGLLGLPLVLDTDVPLGNVKVRRLCIAINPADRPDGACPKVTR